MSTKNTSHVTRRKVAKVGSPTAVLLTALALLAPGMSPFDGSTRTAYASDTVAGAPLPFDLPPASVLRSSPRKAFAHYIPSFPQSFDNAAEARDYYTTQYLNPTGEGGKHAAYGGFVRDRPTALAPMTDPAWKLRHMETDVQHAAAAGLDGFSIDLFQLGDTGGQWWDNTLLLMQAAQNVDPGFKIMIMPDMTAIGDKDPATLAKYVAQLGAYSSAYRLPDGRLVVSPFYSEGHSVVWWQQFLSSMATTYHTPVAFLPLFLNEQPYENAFAPISYGMSNWGNRNPAGNDPTQTYSTSPAGRIARVHALGQSWMAPVSVQDERPNQAIFDEAQNTTNLRNTWQIAIQNHAELVQLPTWNDYAENADIAPTNKHGWSLLDISAYYLTQWKAGAAPAIVRDTVYLTHRTQPVAARPTFPETSLMTLRGGSSPARDTVEALTYLVAPATVQLQVGDTHYSCAAPAGPGVCTVPLSMGTVSVQVVRAGTDVAGVTSPFPVTATPYVQDLQYVGVSSGRSGTRTVVATDTTAPTAPGSLTATVSGTSAMLNWGAASDDTGVTRYEVHRSTTAGFTPSTSTLVASPTATTFSQTLTPGTWYYRVTALDAAGNRSFASAQASAVIVPALSRRHRWSTWTRFQTITAAGQRH